MTLADSMCKVGRQRRAIGTVALALPIIVGAAVGILWAVRDRTENQRSAVDSSAGPLPSAGAVPRDTSRPPRVGEPREEMAATMIASVVTEEGERRWRQLEACLDPQRDGWKSEAIAERVSSRLVQLANRLSESDPLGIADLAGWLATSPRCGTLVPTTLIDALHDASIRVQRDAHPEATAQLRDGTVRTVLDQLNSLRDQFESMSDVRFAFKVYRIDANDQTATATVMFYARGNNSQGALQLNSTWQTVWQLAELPSTEGAIDEPKLASIRMGDYERITTFAGSPTLYTDRTEAVLGADDSYRRQLQYGAGYWMQRLPAYLSPRLLEGHIGLAIGDVNQDGREDVFVCQPGGLPNRLYQQNSDGTATDIAAAAGVDILDWSYSALIVDLDNDGRQDLAVVADGQVLVYQGNGAGRFTLRAKLSGTFEYAICAADYDLDGDLDLYVCNYFAEAQNGLAQLERTDPLHDSNTGGRNALFRNEGEWHFVDVTEETGLDVANRRWTLAAGWEDFDNDGDPDLYVVNDFGHNNLFRNDGGQFVDVAPAAGAVDANQGMSVAWADYDHDGWMDVYVSNMFSSAGNRVTTQPNFMPGLAMETKDLYRQLARGNTLLRNAGDGTFEDVSVAANVTMGRWAWASLFTDINNDGWEDLVVANGYLTQDNADDL
jgi:hypothetical protein